MGKPRIIAIETSGVDFLWSTERMLFMKAKELRQKYVQFFQERNHKEILASSLLPENDPTVLFTTAGMHPLVPYLLGEVHPQGTRLVGCQKCIRTCDIDEVGDATHLTFFEMLGNWSLGDYFKKESITMSYEFLTEELGMKKEEIAVTVFEGDDLVPRDQEVYDIWKSVGLKDSQIFYYGRKENWWGPAGETGPCGPDTEIFYDNGQEKCSDTCGPACHCGKYVEIWNNVFMEYKKHEDGSFTKLEHKNVDTGMGLERILATLNHMNSVYEIDVLYPIIEKFQELTGLIYTKENEKEIRIITDHIRAITFIMGDDKRLTPSNSEQGYILRRLIRRTIRILKKLNVQSNILIELARTVIGINEDLYIELKRNKEFIYEELEKEYQLFTRTLDSGLKKAEGYLNQVEDGVLSGELAFRLYDTFGFPIELTCELASERGFEVDLKGYDNKFKEHQEKSRLGGEAKFKGGLADHSEQTTRLHTATHLLLGALRRVLGEEVYQKGSNINSGRLRFDFSFGRKLTKEELEQVESIVNEAIQKDIQVLCEEMTVEEAKAKGALGIFDHKYEQLVKVYTIEGYSKEICGGPHANSTGELKHFKIAKEESSSSGVRRIKAMIG